MYINLQNFTSKCLELNVTLFNIFWYRVVIFHPTNITKLLTDWDSIITLVVGMLICLYPESQIIASILGCKARNELVFGCINHPCGLI